MFEPGKLTNLSTCLALMKTDVGSTSWEAWQVDDSAYVFGRYVVPGTAIVLEPGFDAMGDPS